MRLCAVIGVVLLILGLTAGVSAQDEPEARLWVHAIYTGTWTWRSAKQSSDKVGEGGDSVITGPTDREEASERATLIFSGTTTWKFRDGVPTEMTDNCKVSGFGQGSFNNVSKHVDAVNRGGKWAPYRYTVTEQGAWSYSVPEDPSQKGFAPILSAAGGVVITPIGTYHVELVMYPNLDQLTSKGSWSHTMSPQGKR